MKALSPTQDFALRFIEQCKTIRRFVGDRNWREIYGNRWICPFADATVRALARRGKVVIENERDGAEVCRLPDPIPNEKQSPSAD
jgi:hypothetical protein